MVTAIQSWKTHTMIFNDTESVYRFLSFFPEALTSFENLNKEFFESKELEEFSIRTESDRVVFLWKFKDRESYNRHMLLLRNSEFFPILIKYIGWDLKKIGSA